MCKTICPNPKCGKTTETNKPQMCYYVGRLKFAIEVSPKSIGGTCPKCGVRYTERNPPSVSLCPFGEAGYEKTREQYEFQKRVRGMNAGLIEKIKNKHSLIPRKVA